MINLLPSVDKQNIVYARRNTKLVKLCALLLSITAGVVAISFAGLFYMNQSITNLNQQAARTTEILKSKKIDDVEKQVNDISNNLKLTSQVLSKQVFFSKLLKQIGAAMPANTVLTDLKIGKTDGAIDITAAAANYDAATQVQVNLSDPANKIFDKADLLSVNCSNSSTDPNYPCKATLRARFAKNNSFTFTGGSK